MTNAESKYRKFLEGDLRGSTELDLVIDLVDERISLALKRGITLQCINGALFVIKSTDFKNVTAIVDPVVEGFEYINALKRPKIEMAEWCEHYRRGNEYDGGPKFVSDSARDETWVLSKSFCPFCGVPRPKGL